MNFFIVSSFALSLKDLKEGQALKCSKGGNDNPLSVYRYSKKQIRWYPNPTIATSWDPNWRDYDTVDCDALNLDLGPNMGMAKPPMGAARLPLIQLDCYYYDLETRKTVQSTKILGMYNTAVFGDWQVEYTNQQSDFSYQFNTKVVQNGKTVFTHYVETNKDISVKQPNPESLSCSTSPYNPNQ